MINIIIRNIIIFFVVFILQLVVLNHINLTNLDLNPMLYVLIILTLPFETPGWLLLLIAFSCGLTMDIFTDSLGVHSSACVFMAFLRPFILQVLSPRDGYESGQVPVLSHFGFAWYFRYSAILIFTHHLIFYFMEVFSFNNFFVTIWYTLLTSVFTLIFILLSQLFIFTRKKRRI